VSGRGGSSSGKAVSNEHFPLKTPVKAPMGVAIRRGAEKPTFSYALTRTPAHCTVGTTKQLSARALIRLRVCGCSLVYWAGPSITSDAMRDVRVCVCACMCMCVQ
jgi:hypothetical protein